MVRLESRSSRTNADASADFFTSDAIDAASKVETGGFGQISPALNHRCLIASAVAG